MKHITTDKQVILVRTDLKMNAGKIGAQCAHASWLSLLSIASSDEKGIFIPKDERSKDWFENKFTKTVLAVNSEQELEELCEKASKEGMLSAIVVDSGLTTFNYVPTKTVGAIGPDKSEKIDKITGHLKSLR